MFHVEEKNAMLALVLNAAQTHGCNEAFQMALL